MIKIRIHNNDNTDFVDYEGNTVDDIQKQAKNRIKLPAWNHGWSERLID